MGRKKSKTHQNTDPFPALRQISEEVTKPEQFEKLILELTKSDRYIQIAPRERRFKDGDKEIENLSKEVTNMTGYVLKTRTNSMGCFVIEIVSKSDKKDTYYTDDKIIRFLIKEAFSVQENTFVKVSEKLMRKIVDMRNDYALNRWICIRPDYKKERLNIEGGRQSVQAAVKEIKDFIGFHTNIVTIVLEIPQYLHMFFDVVKPHVQIVLAQPDRNKISLTGNEKIINSLRAEFNEKYEKLKKTTIFKSIQLTPVQLKVVVAQIGSDLFKKERISTAYTKTKRNQHLLEIAGESEKVEAIFKKISDTVKNHSEYTTACPYWVAKNLIVEEFDKKLSEKLTNVILEINPNSEEILIYTSPDKSEDILKMIKAVIEDLRKELTFEIIALEEDKVKYFDSNKLKKIESGANIFIETGLEKNSIFVEPINPPKYVCLIVGVKANVKTAKNKVFEMLKFYENFVSKKITIENYLHKYIIGLKGKNLNELIETHGRNCTVSFDKTENSNICSVTGPQNEIEKLINALIQKTKETQVQHFKLNIEIPVNIRNIISNNKNKITGIIKKICTPEIQWFSDRIEIIGRQELMNKVKTALETYINDVAQSITKEINVPPKLVVVVAECGDALAKAINDDAGGSLTITLPNAKNPKDKITIFGPADIVNRSVDIFNKLATSSEEFNFDTIKIERSNITPLQSQIFQIINGLGVRVYFPPGKKENETLLILGKKDAVEKVKKSVVETLGTIKNTVCRVLNIKNEYKKEFLKKKNDETLVQTLCQQFNIKIAIDRKSDTSTVLEIKGLKQDVENAVNEINQLLSTLDKRIEKSVQFSIEKLNHILSSTKGLLKETMNKYNVTISISQEYYSALNTDKKGICVITIKGFEDDVNEALKEISNWEVDKVSIECACSIMRNVLHPRTLNFQKLSNEIGVHINLGYLMETPIDKITIVGLRENVQKAQEFISKAVEDDFELKLTIPENYYNRLIGKKGATIQKFNKDYNVIVNIPSNKDTGECVTIFGNKKDCEIAGNKLKETISLWDEYITKEFEIDSKLKFKICGERNEAIRKIATNHGVSVSFDPAADLSSPIRIFKVTGTPKGIAEFSEIIRNRIRELTDECDEEYTYSRNNYNNYSIDIADALSNAHLSQKQKKNKKKTENANLPSSIQAS